MARLFPTNPNEIALISTPSGGSPVGQADFTVDPSGSTPTVELWERIVPFAAAPPKFSLGPIFPASTPVSRSVSAGSIYQARLYRLNQGGVSGDGPILGKCDFPAVRRAARVNFLTRCASVPQIGIKTGGTFVSMVFATNVVTRARVQIGDTAPAFDPTGFAFFPPQNVVATAVSETPTLIHQVTLLDELLQGETTLHPPLSTGQKLFFVVFVWDATGAWDIVWNTTGVAPTTPPESITTKQRSVGVSLRKLVCLDDSDDLSDGEATFTLVVIDSTGTAQTKSVGWNPMGTGKATAVNNTSVQVNPPNAAGPVLVRIDAVEDDSGSFPPDSDDSTSTMFFAQGGDRLFFPVGEKHEEVDNAVVNLANKPMTDDESFHFTAEVRYSVTYV
jgi:hypothetical protein